MIETEKSTEEKGSFHIRYKQMMKDEMGGLLYMLITCTEISKFLLIRIGLI